MLKVSGRGSAVARVVFSICGVGRGSEVVVVAAVAAVGLVVVVVAGEQVVRGFGTLA